MTRFIANMRRSVLNTLGMLLGGLIALASVHDGALARQQSPTPVFRGGVELVVIPVSVLDKNQQPVRGLTADDFTVLENGSARPIRVLTPIEVPAAGPQPATVAPWIREVPPDVATNQVGEQPGRLVVILMDRSIQHGADTVTARHIATAIVDALGPNDLAALVSTSGGDPQNFTADRTRLIKAIAQRDWSTDSDENPWTLTTALNDGRCLCGLCVLDTITRIASAVHDSPGRSKSLFFIGRGLIVQADLRDPKADVGCDRLVRDSRAKMLDAVALSGLVIHSIDPTGLTTVGPQTLASSRNGAAAPPGVAAALRRQAQQDETNGLLANQGTLHVLPDLTGGRAVINRNTPEETVPAIFKESESYYLLGFEAGPGRHADGSGSIDVKVRRSDVHVVAQHKYLLATSPAAVAVASSAPPSSGKNDALSGLLPGARPPLKLALAAFANADGPRAFVSISVDVGAFVPRASSSISLRVSSLAVDQTGRTVASAEQRSTIVVPPSGPTAWAPLDLQTHLELLPGDYEVRVAVADAGEASTASVFAQVAVPAFSTEPLSLSDIAIARADAGNSDSTAPILPVAPTTQRAIRRSEPIQAFLQVYQGTERSDALLPVTVRTQIVDAQNRIANDTTTTIQADAFANRRADYRALIPTQQLAPGEYLVRAIATAGQRTTQRMMRLAVQ